MPDGRLDTTARVSGSWAAHWRKGAGEGVAVTFGNGDRRAGRDASLGELVAMATKDVSLLVRQEIDLAKAELARQAASAAVGAGLIGVAAGLGLGAMIAMTIFFGELFAWAGLERFWAFLLTAVLLLALAGLVAMVGALRLRKLRPPQRAISSVREDVALLRHPVGGSAGRSTGTAPAGTPAPAGTTASPGAVGRVASIPPARGNGQSSRPAGHDPRQG